MSILPALIAFISLLPAETTPRLALRGTVEDVDGKPVAGARVSIATAAPRVGQALFCPSCYRDCTKWTRSDAQGRFEISGLDPTLKFTVLATAPGLGALHTRLLDPLKDEVKITLEPLPLQVPRDRTVLGQLEDESGQAVAGALISPFGGQKGERRWWGPVKGVNPTVSDAEGRFRLVLPEGYLGVDIQITAGGYAGTSLALLKPGPIPQRIIVPAGARVTGRLLHAGQPVAGLRIAVVQIERGAGDHFIKAVGDVTDDQGKFVFAHLPANQDYAIFTPVGEVLSGERPQKLVLATKKFRAPGDRKERNLGELAAIPALRLAGRVEASPGLSLPADAKIALGRDPAWDLIAVPVGKDGSFVIEGLPPETYTVRVAANGFVLDGARVPYQMLRDNSFGLRLRETLNVLRIPVTPSDGNAKD